VPGWSRSTRNGRSRLRTTPSHGRESAVTPWRPRSYDWIAKFAGALTRRTRGSLAERSWELLRQREPPATWRSTASWSGEQQRPIDWNKVLREMRAAEVRASGDDEHDLRALWERAVERFAPLGQATVVALAERPGPADRPGTRCAPTGEEEGGQLASGLAA
jgi:hypothetical protein